ncbi:MAG TPA: WS/DGAT domain-containing protein [Pseudonocardiaceae bacterium]|nr:WS/DGAT domain-containing protein [Pseudonocardiaceae bacterium]
MAGTTSGIEPDSPPRRALIVSADMGEGHNATGRALAEAARQRWPGVEIRWLDTLDVMGRGVGPVFRRIYVTNVESTPWLYEFFYDSLCRYPWFAQSSKRFVGAWAGRRLARHIAEFRPDVILSTYPLGTAALHWLRRHRGLSTPTGAWVSDFAPHPFWVYDGIDLNLVMHDVAADVAHRLIPDAPVAVAAPPVVNTFSPGDKAAARRALGLPDDELVALVSCGSLGFGSVESAVRTVLDADPATVVVVACGRNESLRTQLLAGGDQGGRLRALGWVDDMATLTVAADVVVTNAGGATALEALACGRAVLMYRPIAAHGRANAELMARAGLAEVCADERELAQAVRRLRAEPDRLAEIEAAALRHAGARTVADGLDALLAVAQPPTTSPTPRRLRAEDALFVHIQTEQVPQQLGAVLILDAKDDGAPITFAEAVDLFDAAPGLRGRIDPGTAWRQPAWRPDESIRTADVVTELELGLPNGPAELEGAMDAFFSRPLDGRAHAGEAQLVRGLGGGTSALLIKLHHATADGIAVIGALVGRARGQNFIAEPTPNSVPPRRTLAQRLSTVGELAGGLVALARAGKAPHSALDGRITAAARHHALVDLPAAEVRAVARALHARTTDVPTALLGEALHRVLHTAGQTADVRPPSDTLRVMMPRSTRTTATYRRAGNHTGAASVDLPIGPMSLAERLAVTRAATDAQTDSAAPHAAHAVVWLLGLLPPWAHRQVAKLVYRATWFNAIASVLPGARSPVIQHGSRVSNVFAVLALAPGVGLSVGIMTWADRVTLCLTGAPHTAIMVDELAEAVLASFKEMRAGAT